MAVIWVGRLPTLRGIIPTVKRRTSEARGIGGIGGMGGGQQVISRKWYQYFAQLLYYGIE
jgi:hypothetical protein